MRLLHSKFKRHPYFTQKSHGSFVRSQKNYKNKAKMALLRTLTHRVKDKHHFRGNKQAYTNKQDLRN